MKKGTNETPQGDVKLNAEEQRAIQLASKGMVQQAVVLLRRAASKRRKQGNLTAAGWDWFMIGGFLRPDKQQWKAAGDAYGHAGTIFHKVGERKGLMLSLLRYAQVMAQGGNYDEVVEPASMAMDMAQEAGDRDTYLEAMLVVWSGMHATSDPGLADFLRDASNAPIITQDQAVKDRVDLFTKDLNELDDGFETRLLAARDMGTLAHYYNRKGSAVLRQGHVDEAIEYLTLGKHAAVQSQDIMAYFLNVLGLVMAYEMKDDKMGAMQALLLGATSLRNVLGDVLDEYFYMVFNGLRAIWGDEELDRVMSRITEALDLKTGRKEKDDKGD